MADPTEMVVLCDWLGAQVARTTGLDAERLDLDSPLIAFGVSPLESLTLAYAVAERVGVEPERRRTFERESIASLIRVALARSDEAALRRAALLDRHPNEVAIVGLACRLPGAADARAFWRLLVDGVDAITEVPRDRWNIDAFYSPDAGAPGSMVSRYGGFLHGLDLFDEQFFRVSPREAAELDPRQRLTLELAWEALEDAGIRPGRLAGTRAGVFMATLSANYGSILFNHYLDSVDAYSGSGNGNSVTANRISYFLDLLGPSLAVDTACSGSLVAIHLACQSLRSGESTVALAGGVNVILKPDDSVFFSKTGALSPDGRCKAFDGRADGIARSDGAGVVVLKRLGDALADGDRCYAVIRGTAVNQDGATPGLMSPSQRAQEALLREACARAGIRPGQIQYVDAHGTGTAVGDPIEARALGAVLADGRSSGLRCAIGSVKTNIGHAEAAAGIAGLIKVALAIHHRVLPASLHFEEPNPQIPFERLPLRVQTELGEWPDPASPLLAGVSAFGFAGTNAHAVLGEAPPLETAPCEPLAGPFPLALSARSGEGLRALARALAAELRAGQDELPQVCRAAALRREHLERRAVILADDSDDACRKLDALGAGEADAAHEGTARASAGRPAFVFSGQGSHWPRMGASLIDHEPVFAAVIDACDAWLAGEAGFTLRELLHGAEDDARIHRTDRAQPAIFAVQVGLAALLRSWGVTPGVVIGQSLGELAAAHVSGALSLEDALRVVYHRSRLMQRVAGQGATAVIGLPVEEVPRRLAAHGGRISVAGTNSLDTTVVAGDQGAIDELVAALSAEGLLARRLEGVDVAFHSHHMDPLTGDLVRAIDGIAPRTATVPLFCALTGARVNGSELDARYWQDNLRAPFRLPATLAAARPLGSVSYLEVSPHAVLSGPLASLLRAHEDDAAVISTMRRGGEERRRLLEAVASVHVRGHAVDWRAVLRATRSPHVSLPLTQWQRRRFWFDQLAAPVHTGFDPRTGGREVRRPDGRATHPLLGQHVEVPGAAACHVWTTELGAQFPAWLADHRVRAQTLLPAAGFLEMAMEAGAQVFPDVGVEELAIDAPLALPESGTRRVQVVLTSLPRGRARVEIFAEVPDAPAGGERLQRCATADVRPTRLEPVGADLDGLRARCPVPISRSEHLAAMAARGLHYGPAFRALAEIRRGEGEALGRLVLPAAARDGSTSYHMHPVLLDAGLQLVACAAPAAPGGGAGEVRLPVGVRAFSAGTRAPETLWCHALLRSPFSPAAEEIEADLAFFDDAGALVARGRGLRMRRVDAASASATPPADVSDWFHEVTWPLAPLPLADRPAPSTCGGPALADLAASLAPRIARWSDDNELTHYAGHPEAFDGLSAAHVERALAVLGWKAQPGDVLYAAALASELGVAPRHGRLFARLLDILSEDGVLEAVGGRSGCHRVLRGLLREDPSELRAAAQARFPAAGVELALITRAGERLADLLAGRCEALDVLFPDEDDHLLRDLYEDTVFTRVYNRIVAAVAAEGVEKAGGGQPLRILELGAGTGATTGQVLAQSAGRPLEYMWTDQSRMLLHRAQRRFAGDGRLSFRVLDIEHDPVAQGFGEGSCDVVIAANVIHATRDVRRSLSHASRLLAPGGLLVLLEGPGPQRWFDLIVGATDGWWRFEDHDLRPDYPLLPSDRWVEVLREVGFVDTAVLTDASGRPPQFVVVGRARAASAARAGARKWLVLGDGAGLGRELSDRLRIAEPLSAVTHEIDPAIAGPRLRELAGGDDAAFVGVVDLNALDLPALEIEGGPSTPALDAIEARACAPVLDVARAVNARPPRVDVRWWLVTRGCQPAGPAAEIAVAQAPLWGLGRVFATELPDAFGALVDLDPAPAADDADRLLREVLEGPAGEQVALRGDGRRHVARLVRRPPLPPVATPLRLRGDGSYLVTGGLSGIGRVTSRWLVDHGARRLVVLTRTALPPRSAWSALAAGDPAAERVAAVRELEVLGAVVHHAAVDVGDDAALSAFLDTYQHEGWPAIRGVVHAAGLIDDHLLVNLDRVALERVSRPKIRGSWTLHRHPACRDLDLFLVFSSGTSLVGTEGQGNYAAGNAFLDALAHHRRARGLVASSINWGVWADVGIIARSAHKERLARAGLGSIHDADGLRVMERVVRGAVAQIGVMPTDWERWRRAFPAAAARSFFPPAELAADSVGGTHDPETGRDDGWRAAVLAAAEDQREGVLSVTLAKVVAGILRVDPQRLDPARSLSEYGLDSIMAVEVKEHVEMGLGVSISVVELLRGATVSSIAAQVLSRLAPAREAIAALLAEVEQLSPDEVRVALQRTA